MGLTELLKCALEDITKSSDTTALKVIKVSYLGKSGKLTTLLKSLKDIPKETRAQKGSEINSVKRAVEEAINIRQGVLEQELLEKKLKDERIDVSLPGVGVSKGSLHPITMTQRKIENYFFKMGFERAVGPELETDYYNFTALNISEFHPARAMHDTFYCDNNLLLRTHTSPVQIRSMKNQKPPIKLIAPGKVYRRDSDITHSPMFHQIEGLYIDKDVSLANLHAVMQDFFEYFFSKELQLRLRSSYFPFTEPSAEIDITCVNCKGKGCNICKYTGWIEVAGCGMVHPKVLEHGGIDTNEYTGWAFGMGIDRMAMLRYGVTDLRKFFSSDLSFLEQFKWF